MKFLRGLAIAILSLLLLVLLLLGGLVYELHRTVLQSDLVYATVVRSDVLGQVRTLVQQAVPEEQREMAGRIADASLAENRTEILKQLRAGLDQTWAYLRGDRAGLVVSFDVEPLLKSLIGHLREGLRDQLPEEARALPPAEREKMLDAAVAQIEGAVRQQLKAKGPLAFDVATLPKDAQESVRQARQAITIFVLASKILIGAALVVAALLLWAASLSTLGIVIALGGVLVGGLALLASSSSPLLLANAHDMPEEIRAYLPRLVRDLTAPLTQFALACLGVGFAAWFLSLFVRRQPATPEGMPPAPRSYRKIGIGVAVGAVLAAGAAWAGDAVNRYRAAGYHEQGEAAWLNSDWPAAFASLSLAVKTRPADADYRGDFDHFEEVWMRLVRARLDGMSPGAGYTYLAGEPSRLAPFLTEPHATHRQKLAEANLAGLRSDLESSLAEAAALAAAGQAQEAAALIEAARPYAAVYDKFAADVARVKAAGVREALGRAADLVAKHNFSGANAALESVKADRALVGDEYADGVTALRMQQFLDTLDLAVVASDQGDLEQACRILDQASALAIGLGRLDGFTASLQRALASVDPKERAALMPPARVERARAEIQRNIENQTTQQLVRCLTAGQPEETQKAIDRRAQLTKQDIAVTAAALHQERDFNRFLGLLTELHIHPAEESARANRTDLLLVENLRTRFSAAPEAAQFIARSYTDWARTLLADDLPASALYLLKQARQAGAPAETDLEKAAMAKLTERHRTAVYFPAIAPVGKGAARLAAACRAAAREVIVGAVGSWIHLEEELRTGAGAEVLELRAAVARVPVEHSKSSQTRTSRYRSGTSRSPNPEYQSRQEELAAAESAYESAQRAESQTESAMAESANAGDLGAIVAATTIAVARGAVAEASGKVSAARSRLANTARTIETATYADAEYEVITHQMAHAATCELTTLVRGQKSGASSWSAQLNYQATQVAGNARINVRAVRPAFLAAQVVEDRLAQDLTAKIAAQKEAALRPLAEATFRALGDAIKDAPEKTAAEASWAWSRSGRPGG